MPSRQMQQKLSEKELYEELGKNFRYFLDWREKILAGYLTTLVALAVAFSWTQPKSLESLRTQLYAVQDTARALIQLSNRLDSLEKRLTALEQKGSIRSETSIQEAAENFILFGVIVVSIVFWILDFRNRDLWRVCRDSASVFEENLKGLGGTYMSLKGLDAWATEQPTTTKPDWLTHGSAVNLLVSAVISVPGGFLIHKLLPSIDLLYLNLIVIIVCLILMRSVSPKKKTASQSKEEKT